MLLEQVPKIGILYSMNKKLLTGKSPTPHEGVTGTELADAGLLARAKAGDERAFEELVRKYEHLVYSFAFKVCRNKDYAEETLQDTFVNVFRKVGQFDGKSKLSTWLYSIVANNCLMKRRRTKLEEHSVSIDEHTGDHDGEDGNQPASHVPVWHETPLSVALTSELRQRMDEAIQRMPVDYRLVFILRDIEGQSAADTSKIMKLSVPAVKSRLRRARVFLREELREFVE